MVLGTMAFDFSMYGNERKTTCNPIEGVYLAEQLREAMGNIQGKITAREQEIREQYEKTIPADPSVRNYSYTLVDGELYYRENSVMYKPDLPQTSMERAKDMVRLRDLCRAVIDTASVWPAAIWPDWPSAGATGRRRGNTCIRP